MESKITKYFKGIFCFILSLTISAINDNITKYISYNLDIYEILFLRFLFSTVILIPITLIQKNKFLKSTHNIKIHFLRGILLFLGIYSWTYGIKFSQVSTATVIGFTIPIFILILGTIFLKEFFFIQRWIITIITFSGLILTLDIKNPNFNPKVLIFIFGALNFAILDIINKKIVHQEPTILMLLSSSITTTLVSAPFIYTHWKTPSISEIFFLILLGINANLIMFFLLKALSTTDVTALAPYRYLELVISSIIAYYILNEIPHKSTIYGALIIIPSTLITIVYEKKQIIKNEQNQINSNK